MEEGKNTKSEWALREEKILEFWKEKNIFQKSLEKNKGKEKFVFYEGPPGANGVPMLHHLEARAFKDVIPRYKTMQGFFVDRRAGWDCHGLPVELQAEKELGLKSKKEIEVYGIDKYNEYCRKTVLRYTHEWEVFTDRMGYWIDNDRAYYTMDNDFIESSWYVVAEAEKRGLLIKDYKILPWCSRCGTGLSSHELGQPGVYQDVKDLSVYVKFKVKNEVNTYILAWTTTPWTLPGNVALAVGKDIEYYKIFIPESFDFSKVDVQTQTGTFIFAKERATQDELHKLLFMSSQDGCKLEIVKGSDLVGLEYEPLFPYLADTISESEKEKLKNAYKVYDADFVTTEDGTGVVHTAVMYGADDFDLGTKVGLPKHHMVNPEGNFIEGTGFLEGRYVKEKDEKGKPTLAVDIVDDLTKRNLFFKKENYEHSYPHCWRCKSPLIYYARDSWYFAMSTLRDELGKINQQINWEPAHLKEGRFGEWLREIKDWAISRERYWGTPLPVWLSNDGEKLVVDSVETIRKCAKNSGNKYFVMRHGGAEGNKKGIVSYKNQADDHLTEEGKKQVLDTARELKQKKIDVVVTSHFTRTKETTEILVKELGLGEGAVVEDKRLCEINPGDFDGGNWDDYHNHVKSTGPNWFDRQISNGESLKDVKRRTAEVLYDLEEKYKGKTILIVTHGAPAWLLYVNTGLYEPDHKEYVPANTHVFVKEFKRFDNAEVRELPFVPLPHDDDYNLDLHRPYIDEVVLEKDGKEFKRTKEVMDVWFDSGAMPYAQDHYPFDFEPGKQYAGQELPYPADFISEAVDQTRGWFYTLVAVSALLGRSTPFKNVICLGHLLDKDGQKMSKSKGNVIDPWEEMNQYGADTVRMWMYSVTQPGDSKNYDPKVVRELQNKIFNLYSNVLSFYELYRDQALESEATEVKSDNVLDIWILARHNQFLELVSDGLDSYKIFEPARGFRDFIDDLSTWYLRRSRDRIKEGDANAKKTLYFVMKNLAKILAPFAPFFAEDVWKKLRNNNEEESVHLSDWPKADTFDQEIVDTMQSLREVVSAGLKERQVNNIQVRQPLLSFTIKEKFTKEFEEILKDELNIKEVLQGSEVKLNTELTPELKEEGNYRELVRAVQDMRKKMNLVPSDVVELLVETDSAGEELVKKFMDDFVKTVGAKNVMFGKNNGTEVEVCEKKFRVELKK